MGETKEIRDFIMKMKIGFRVIANSNEKKSRERWRNEEKKTKKGLPRKGKQTLFVNYIDEKKIVSKSKKEWKRKKPNLK